jgi:hypothetical protein
MNRLISLLMLIALLMLGIQPSAIAADEANKINRFTVHGRLSRYNGNPSHRIWIVGTHRLLGVSESIDEVPSMPMELLAFLSSDQEVFADFVVEALTPSKPGTMQMVRIVSVSKIVVRENANALAFKGRLE